MQATQGKSEAELAEAHRRNCEAMLQHLGRAHWTTADMETLPFGVAVPLHEGLQLQRDSPPASAPPSAQCACACLLREGVLCQSFVALVRSCVLGGLTPSR